MRTGNRKCPFGRAVTRPGPQAIFLIAATFIATATQVAADCCIGGFVDVAVCRPRGRRRHAAEEEVGQELYGIGYLNPAGVIEIASVEAGWLKEANKLEEEERHGIGDFQVA